MAKTLLSKVWDAHTVRELPSGQTQLFIGLHLVHEVTSPQAFQMLRERGLLDVEADVNTYLPYQVARRGITTAQLMSKCSRSLCVFLRSLKAAAAQRTPPPSPTTITSPFRRTSSTWMATP